MKKTVITLLVLALALSFAPAALAGPFADVPANHWAYGAVNQLVKDGLVEGYADGTFRGDKALTRYEMAIVVGKALEHVDKATAEDKALLDKLSNEFAKELESLGVRVTKLEQKVDEIGKIKITGTEELYYRTVNDDPNVGRYGNKTTYGDNIFTLRMNAQAGQDVNVFARLTERTFFGGAYKSTTFSTFFNTPTIDEFGASVNSGLWNIKAGRQEVIFGEGTLIATGHICHVGPLFEGVVASGRTSNDLMHFQLIGGRTGTNDYITSYLYPDYQGGTWWGANVNYKLSNQITLGALYATERRDVTPAEKYTYKGMSATLNFGGPFSLTGEYIKSDADTDNRAYHIVGTYHQDKDTVLLYHIDTQKNAVDQYTSWINGGYQYPLGAAFDKVSWNSNCLIWLHNMTKNVTTKLLLESSAETGETGRNTEAYAGVIIGF